MALTKRLDAYLTLERQMMTLDDAGDSLADSIRDALDPIWYALSDEEHRFLDSRGMCSLESLYPACFPTGEALFVAPPELQSPVNTRDAVVGRVFAYPASTA